MPFDQHKDSKSDAPYDDCQRGAILTEFYFVTGRASALETEVRTFSQDY